jgi:lysophospholipase L1-like esterase
VTSPGEGTRRACADDSRERRAPRTRSAGVRVRSARPRVPRAPRSRRPRASRPGALLAVVAALVLAGCGSDDADDPSALQVLSLGDSLAVGVQPKLLGGTQETTQGYPRRFAATLRDRGDAVHLIELGCGGATSASILSGGKPCGPKRDTPYRNEEPTTSQLSYAQGLLSTTRGKRRLVLVDIGGNDVGSCFTQGRIVPGCIAEAGAALRENLDTLLERLRLVDPDVPIGVLTLYDPLLGLWDAFPDARPLLRREHRTFLRRVNGAIVAATKHHDATLVDLAGAMDQAVPLRATTGTRPPAVAAVCRYSWMCVDAPRIPDIHLRREGYELAARTAIAALGPLTKGR